MKSTNPDSLLRNAVAQVTYGETLDQQTMTEVVNLLMEVDLSSHPCELLAGSLLCSLKTRGETVEEIVGAALSLRSHQIHVPLADAGESLLDTCGTGGDGAHLINISTLTGLVAATLGVKVVKHGNRSVSSACGSADLLEAMDYPLLNSSDDVAQCVRETGFGFLFAPHFHPALRNLASLRRSLGVRTLFNMLGPLVNPAGATHQLIGVFSRDIVTPMARAAAKLGLQRCLVVHGEGGLDELSPNGTSWVSLCQGETLEEMEWTPKLFGASPVPLESLAGGTAVDNARISQRLFAGEAPELARAVAMNCAASLWLVGETDDFSEGYQRSYEALQSGRVGAFFENARAFAASMANRDAPNR